jgi:hypothetical protein
LQPGPLSSSSSSRLDKPAAPELPAYLAAAAANAGDVQLGKPHSSSSNSSSANKPAIPELPAYLAAGDGAANIVAAAHAAAGSAAAAAVVDAAAAAGWPGVLADVLSPLGRFYDQEDDWRDVGAFSKVRWGYSYNYC